MMKIKLTYKFNALITILLLVSIIFIHGFFSFDNINLYNENELNNLNINPSIVYFGESYAEKLALELIIQNVEIDIDSIVEYGVHSISKIIGIEGPIIWVGHGSNEGIQLNKNTVSWDKIEDIISQSKSDLHFFVACNSNKINLSNMENEKDVLTFNGKLDAVFGAYYVSKLLNSNKYVNFLIEQRVIQLSKDPSVIIPMASQDDNTVGSNFDFSPTGYAISYEISNVEGTGGYYSEIKITTSFTANQEFIDFYEEEPNLVYVHEIEIRKGSGTSTHIFGYDNGETISHDIENSVAEIDEVDFLVDSADDPEFEWSIYDPEDLTVDNTYTLVLKYWTENDFPEGCYNYKVMLTAEVDGEGLLYGVFYYLITRNYDFLMFTEEFQVCSPPDDDPPSGGGGGGGGHLLMP